MQLTAEQRVAKAGIALINSASWRAMAGVLMVGSQTVVEANDPKVPTACTNGHSVWYNRGFVDKLTDAELRFLRLHEELHKAFRHTITWRWMWKRNAHLANIACDHVINIIINDDTSTLKGKPMFKMPEGGICDFKFRGWDAAKIFHYLEKNPDEVPPQGGAGQPGDGEPSGFDVHDWEGAEAMTEEQEQELSQQIDRALRQGAIAAGKTGSGGNRAVEELTNPQIPWQDALAEFITSHCRGRGASTYRRPNRRFMQHRIYIPTSISETIGELVIGADMSGSIAKELPVMFTEVRSILDMVTPERVRILYWDTKVCREEVYEPHQYDNILDSTSPRGGGGTSPGCVAAHLREKHINPECVIMLTDGHFSNHGTWAHPLLWVSIGNKNFTSPVGRVVHADVQ